VGEQINISCEASSFQIQSYQLYIFLPRESTLEMVVDIVHRKNHSHVEDRSPTCSFLADSTRGEKIILDDKEKLAGIQWMLSSTSNAILGNMARWNSIASIR
jgi:hypothetical protein